MIYLSRKGDDKMYNKINTKIIEDYIKKNKLTINGFCKLCKISLSTYKKIMNNDNKFRIAALFRVADILGIKVFQLFVKPF